ADLGLAEAPAPPHPVLALRGAARTFPGPPEVQALKPTDLRIERGVYVSIVGPSGSGKSTLLHLLGLLDRPTAGEYLVDGIPTVAASENERAVLRGESIGFVVQAFHLLDRRTVLDKIGRASCRAIK